MRKRESRRERGRGKVYKEERERGKENGEREGNV